MNNSAHEFKAVTFKITIQGKQFKNITTDSLKLCIFAPAKHIAVSDCLQIKLF